MQVINLQLPVEAVQKLLHVLGQLPNSSDTFGVMVEIQRQGNAQLKQQTDAAAKSKAEQTTEVAPATEAANGNA